MWGVWLLAAQKPANRPGWWKGKFGLFQMLATGVGGGDDVSLEADSLPTDGQGGSESVYRTQLGGRLLAETAQSSLPVIFKLVISGLTSIILVVLSTVNL